MYWSSTEFELGFIIYLQPNHLYPRIVYACSNCKCFTFFQLIDPYTNSKYDLEEDILADGVRNRLVIHDTSEEDFGKYNCSVVNIYGTDGLEILLVQKGLWANVRLVFECYAHIIGLLMFSEENSVIGIVAGVIGGVLFIATASVIVVLFLRYKKGNWTLHSIIIVDHYMFIFVTN